MKTERRHELQTNQLADWIGSQYVHIAPHAKTILAAVILGTAVVIAVAVIFSDRNAAQESAWTEFNVAFTGRDSVALSDVAKRHSGTPVALWARQAQADIDLDRGIAALHSNRDEAMRALSEARKAYTDVIAGASAFPELMQHSLFGLAQAQEASSNLDAAREYYQQVAQKFPGSAFGTEAAARLESIKNTEVVKFYHWFSRQKPRPSSPLSMPNLPGMPDDLTKLPDDPNLPPVPAGGPITPVTDLPLAAPAAPASATPETPTVPDPPAPASEKKAEAPK